jgi:hypothetical protein
MSTFVETLRHAFSMQRADEVTLPPALERLARAAVERGMETPAIILVESLTPVAFLGSFSELCYSSRGVELCRRTTLMTTRRSQSALTVPIRLKNPVRAS